VEGLHLKNIEFDGKNVLNTGIMITGVCPGCSLENVSVQKVKSAIVLNNTRGDQNAPIVLDRVRTYGIWTTPPQVPNDWIAIGIHIRGTGDDTKWVKIRNGRFEGPCNDAIRIDTIGTSEIEISGNRFFNVTNVLTFGRPADKKTFQAQFVSNTVCEAKAGVVMELTPPPVPPNTPPPAFGKFDFVIRQNYFAKTPEIGKVNGADKPEGIKVENNASDANSGGNLGISTVALPPPQPQFATDPNDDAKFLRFSGPQPEIGPSKTKVGAP